MKAEEPTAASAEIIVIPKQVRMDWTDVMALDTELSNMAFRAACVIGYHFNRKSGSTFLRKDTIAALMGVSERAAWDAVAELERLGYLIVKRRDLGTVTRMTKKGPVQVRVAGGKGVANTYLPAFQRSQVAATYRNAKLASQCELWWEQRSQNRVAKVAPQCDPTLTSPSEKNPTRANTSAREGPDGGLGRVGERLRQRLGDAVFASWFGKAKTSGQSGKSASIVVPNRFLQSELQGRYMEDLLACWQAEHPEIELVEIVVAKALSGDAPGSDSVGAPPADPVDEDPAEPGRARGGGAGGGLTAHDPPVTEARVVTLPKPDAPMPVQRWPRRRVRSRGVG